MQRYDLAVLNGIAVLPSVGPLRADIGIKDGKIDAIASSIPVDEATETINAKGLHILPGAIDSHFHIGIYRPHGEDARSESASALSGGVTTILSYFRTGHHYLNKTGPYREIFPEVLALSDGNFFCDYGYHIAPMTSMQLDEVGWLVDQGVTSFKFYMFYKALNLSADSTHGNEYTMTDNYDLGHLYELMERVAYEARERKIRVSLSLHCENPELIRVFIAKVKEKGIKGLEAYSKGRPPLTEVLSIEEAGVLTKTTECPVNLLHLSSRDAVNTAIDLRRRHFGLDMLLETTLHHLALNYEEVEGINAKVNPPIRAKEDQAALWKALLAGEVDTVVSDHACCMEEMKKDELWAALPGFGGTSLLYPVILSEGVRKRSLSLTRAVELASTNSARKFGLFPRKGAIAVGSDADLALCDLEKTQVVEVDSLHSAQDHTPFEGLPFTGWPVMTLLRGRVVFREGEVQGSPEGKYLKRPLCRSSLNSPRTSLEAVHHTGGEP